MIHVDNIGKSFGRHKVLRGVSLEVRAGEMVAIIGASGAGKSTLLRCMNGLEAIEEGGVNVCGIGLTPGMNSYEDSARQVRRHVGLVFQQFNLWPYRTVLENIIEGLLYVQGVGYRAAVEKAKMWAERLGIVDHLKKYPSRLSGGEQQRVAIARSVVMGTEFLLLDEVTSSLDAVRASEILQILEKLKENGIGIVFVSHHLEFTKRSADKVYFLDDGVFKEAGPPTEILVKPGTRELKALVSALSKAQ